MFVVSKDFPLNNSTENDEKFEEKYISCGDFMKPDEIW